MTHDSRLTTYFLTVQGTTHRRAGGDRPALSADYLLRQADK